jgi:hypothetical protein
MRSPRILILSILVVLVARSATMSSEPDQPPGSSGRTVTVEGVVKSLADIAKARKIDGDSEPFAGTMAIETRDGRAILLRSDEGGRMFYLDESMRGRKVRLKIIETADFPLAMIVQAEAMHEGRWRVPQYYCDVCTISVRYPQVCLCCQGPMEFRFKPER